MEEKDEEGECLSVTAVAQYVHCNEELPVLVVSSLCLVHFTAVVNLVRFCDVYQQTVVFMHKFLSTRLTRRCTTCLCHVDLPSLNDLSIVSECIKNTTTKSHSIYFRLLSR